MTALSPESRIWIYQCSRTLQDEELVLLQEKLNLFASDWKAHGNELAAAAIFDYKRFVIIAVDESFEAPSGCSIDKSVHLLKEFGFKHGCDFFGRTEVLFLNEENEMESFLYSKTNQEIESGRITPFTLIFDTTLNRLKELDKKWPVALKETWLRKYLRKSIV